MEHSDTSTYSAAVADLPLLVSELGEKWRQPSLLSLIPTVKPSSKTTGPTSPSPKTSETITASQGTLTLLPPVSPAPEPVTREPAPDSITLNQPSFEKASASSPNVNPGSASSSNPWALSIAALEQCLGDSEWLAIKANLKLSRQQSLGQATVGNDCLLFPTPTACLGTYRAAGANKCEQWLRRQGLIANGSQLSATAYALIQGFPSGWFKALASSPRGLSKSHAPSPPLPLAESKPANWQDAPLPLPKPRSPLTASSTSTPSFPNDLPRPKRQSKRRSPGQGSGYIQLHYCEKQTRSGVKSYEQYYYHYELEVKGKRVKRSAYIPKDKLDVVLEWERKKVAVTAILAYLGKSL